METVIQSIEIILSNAKKSLGHPYSRDTITNKKQEVEKLKARLEQIFNIEKTNTETKNKTLAIFEKLKIELYSVLDQHSKGKIITEKKENFKTLNMDANELAAVTKLIPIFLGKREELHSFTTNLEMVEQTIAHEKKNFFFNFVFKSRLDLKVQNRIKQYTTPTTITELISALKKAYKPLKSSNTILNELTGLTQRNNNLSGFATKIENLISELNELQVTEEGETNRTAIVNTNNKIAFNTFVNGLQDQQLVSTIDASQVTTFPEALQIAERFTARTKQKHVLYHTSQPNRNIREYRNNSNTNNRNRFSYNNNNNGYRQNNYNNNRYRNNNGYNNNNNNRNFNNNNYNRANIHRERNRNNRYGNRNRTVNQIQNQGNVRTPEIITPTSSENTQ